MLTIQVFFIMVTTEYNLKSNLTNADNVDSYKLYLKDKMAASWIDKAPSICNKKIMN